MSQPGWYPDPAGSPGRFRYWDGRAWSPTTSSDPGGTPTPGLGAPGGATPNGAGKEPSDPRGRRSGVLILALALLVVLVLVGVFVVRGLVGDRPIVNPGPLPSSTVSGWDDTSPDPPPEETISPSDPADTPPPTPTPSPTPTAAPSEELPLQPCPVGAPSARQDHPADGRVHGGGLSFPEVSGWEDGGGTAFRWAYDVGAQTTLVETPDWYANLAVGALFTGDGFDEPRRSAELVMQCVITSGLYPDLSGREDIWSKAVTVDGRPGWSIRADVLIDDPDLEATGDTVEVIVVDTDSPESLAMFIGAVTIDDAGLLATMTSTIKNLAVE